MVFNVCVKFHENMSSGFEVMERTRKLLTDTHAHTRTHTHTEKTKTLYPHGILRNVLLNKEWLACLGDVCVKSVDDNGRQR